MASVQMQQSIPSNPLKSDQQLLTITPGWNEQITTSNIPRIKFTFDITFPEKFSLNFLMKKYEDKLSRFEYLAISEITGVAIAALLQVGDILLKVNDDNLIETFEQSQSYQLQQNFSKINLGEKMNKIDSLKSTRRTVRFLRCPDARPSKVLLQLLLDDTKVSSKFLAQSTGDGSMVNTLQVLYSDPNMHPLVKKLMQGQKLIWEIKGVNSTSGGVAAANASGSTLGGVGGGGYNISGVMNDFENQLQVQQLVTTMGITGKNEGPTTASVTTAGDNSSGSLTPNFLRGTVKEGVVKDPKSKWLAFVQIPLPMLPTDQQGRYVYKVPSSSSLFSGSNKLPSSLTADSTNDSTALSIMSVTAAAGTGAKSSTPSRKRGRVSSSSELMAVADASAGTGTSARVASSADFVGVALSDAKKQKMAMVTEEDKEPQQQRSVTMCLGRFASETEAQRAYKKAMEEIKVTGKYCLRRPTDYPWDKLPPPPVASSSATVSLTSGALSHYKQQQQLLQQQKQQQLQSQQGQQQMSSHSTPLSTTQPLTANQLHAGQVAYMQGQQQQPPQPRIKSSASSSKQQQRQQKQLERYNMATYGTLVAPNNPNVATTTSAAKNYSMNSTYSNNLSTGTGNGGIYGQQQPPSNNTYLAMPTSNMHPSSSSASYPKIPTSSVSNMHNASSSSSALMAAAVAATAPQQHASFKFPPALPLAAAGSFTSNNMMMNVGMNSTGLANGSMNNAAAPRQMLTYPTSSLQSSHQPQQQYLQPHQYSQQQSQPPQVAARPGGYQPTSSSSIPIPPLNMTAEAMQKLVELLPKKQQPTLSQTAANTGQPQSKRSSKKQQQANMSSSASSFSGAAVPTPGMSTASASRQKSQPYQQLQQQQIQQQQSYFPNHQPSSSSQLQPMQQHQQQQPMNLYNPNTTYSMNNNITNSTATNASHSSAVAGGYWQPQGGSMMNMNTGGGGPQGLSSSSAAATQSYPNLHNINTNRSGVSYNANNQSGSSNSMSTNGIGVAGNYSGGNYQMPSLQQPQQPPQEAFKQTTANTSGSALSAKLLSGYSTGSNAVAAKQYHGEPMRTQQPYSQVQHQQMYTQAQPQQQSHAQPQVFSIPPSQQQQQQHMVQPQEQQQQSQSIQQQGPHNTQPQS